MIYTFFADGFEEAEAVIPVDFLRRAGKTVFTVGVGTKTVRGSHNIRIQCDLTTDEIEFDSELEGVILPGGMPGTLNLEKCETVQTALDYCTEHGLLIGAICAAPSVLGHKGLLNGKKAVCYPGFESELTGAEICGCPAVTDGNIVTAAGAGAASEFAFELISYFCGKEKADEISKGVRFAG